LHGERIIPRPCVTAIFGSLKKKAQKSEKIINTEPGTAQAIATDSDDVKTETTASARPAAKEGKMNG